MTVERKEDNGTDKRDVRAMKEASDEEQDKKRRRAVRNYEEFIRGVCVPVVAGYANRRHNSQLPPPCRQRNCQNNPERGKGRGEGAEKLKRRLQKLISSL